MTDLNNLVIRCIKNRELLTEPTISLKALLAASGMESYLKLCTKRISEANLIDGKTIIRDLSDPYNLLITNDGIEHAFGIIKGYCDENKLPEYQKALASMGRMYIAINALTIYFNSLRRKELRAIKKQNLTLYNTPKEEEASFKLFATEELKARKLHNIIKRKIVNIATAICCGGKYRNIAGSAQWTQHIDLMY